ncbi:cysteine rich repeat-containing protein [Nitrospirillum pindoramense]|uniref:Cysteine rich repeat protein n=1 Tax=Nitrospirillum amazonense TaxID=28077 RepID=A0A560H8R2_9PROT|nr:cysteine rich repeat-containing protein [Nitrospirillum amazonense]TWB42698.1 cysteine rich repeat protein [Nitrospirillum amazonense]
MMTQMLSRAILALSLVVAPVAAFAQSQDGQPAHPVARAAMKACQQDRQTLCKDEQPGGGRILACLKAHEDKLSPDCKSALATLPAHGPAPQGN